LVKLRRLHSQLHEGTGAETIRKAFYVGYISVGVQPQRLRVTFDTASGQVVVPSAKCQSPVCVERRRYVPQLSATATDVNADGTPVQEGLRLAAHHARRDAISIGISSLDLGDGKVVGDLLREAVCLGMEPGEGSRQACAELGIVAATDLTELPFRAMPQDGTVGLGLEGLSISQTFNFVGQFATSSRGMSPQFGMYLGANGGEIAFGGHNPARLASPLSWLPVLRPDEGYWQVRIRNIRIGNRTVTACEDAGGCRGIVDNCASRLGVPSGFLPEFEAAVSALSSGSSSSGCSGPDMHIELDGATLVLRAEDYIAKPACQAQFAPLQLPEAFAGAFLLGEPILRRYYSVFDVEAKRIGFGLAATSEDKQLDDELPSGAELPAGVQTVDPELASEAQGMTVFLLQALAMQITVALLLSFGGTYVKSTQLFLARLSNILTRSGLLSKSSGLVVAIPPDEVPEGDECVICLGSREDDCCAAGSGKGRPRWCRLRCGHHFHEECIFEWLWKVQRCPVCRCHLLDSGAAQQDSGSPSRLAATLTFQDIMHSTS